MVHRKLSDLPKSERTEGLRVSFEGNKGTTGPLRRNKDKSLCERPFTVIFDYAINMKTAYRGGELFLLDDLLDETTMTSSSGDDDDDEVSERSEAKRSERALRKTRMRATTKTNIVPSPSFRIRTFFARSSRFTLPRPRGARLSQTKVSSQNSAKSAPRSSLAGGSPTMSSLALSAPWKKLDQEKALGRGL